YSETPLTYSRLWRPPFDWMIREGQRAGLIIDEPRLKRVLSASPESSTIYDDPKHESLYGAWWLAEFFPKWRWNSFSKSRSLRLGLGRHRDIGAGAFLDRSTLERIKATAYAPSN